MEKQGGEHVTGSVDREHVEAELGRVAGGTAAATGSAQPFGRPRPVSLYGDFFGLDDMWTERQE